ncbi:MAG: hypothetical protein KC613_23185, partial [Myxococcales bacterium]|nr:hypothetical protein [Myxococcales bacterium]MCB9526665.1 hypothetical protein [Myxococcales bacterium]
MEWPLRRRVWVGLAGLALAGWWAFALRLGAWDLVRGPQDQLHLPAGEQAVWVATLAFALPAQLLLTLAWGKGPTRTPWSAGKLYAVALLALAAVHFGVLGAGTVNDDGPAYLFQARLLAAGHATAPPPPDLVHFDYSFLTVHGGRWFSYLQPGLSLLMVPGVWLGLPALPILLVNAAVPVLARALARRLAGDAAGHWAGLLALTSPWFLIGGATVEPYLPLLALVGAAWWAVGQMARAVAAPVTARWAAAAGLAIGAVVVLRSVEFGLLGLAFGAHQALRLRAAPRRVLLESAALLVGVAPWIGVLLAYNHAVTGSATQVPMLLP